MPGVFLTDAACWEQHLQPSAHQTFYYEGQDVVFECCRIDVVTKEDALDFLQAEENKQKTNE